MTNVKSLLEMYVKMGGSLTDTYSDIAGGVPVGQYSTISDAILACSKKYSSGGGGGGAEKFIVNISDKGGITSYKTVAEIVAAKEAGKDVVANVYIGMLNVTAEIPLIYVFTAPQGQGFAVVFSATVPNMGEESVGENIYTVYGLSATGSDDVWDSDRVSVGGSSNAPLIVTLTESSGTLTGDKTYQEIKEARLAGRPVDIVMTDYTCASVLDVSGGESTISVTFIADGQIVTATGAPSDYVSKTL